jgi:hypothetical protein
MESRDTFSLYIYNLHELVNKMLDKQSGTSYEEIRERYEHFRARCAEPLDKKASHRGGKTRKHASSQKRAMITPLETHTSEKESQSRDKTHASEKESRDKTHASEKESRDKTHASEKESQSRDKTHASEKGCTEPLYGMKAKCVLSIIPQTVEKETLTIDSRCLKRRISPK